MKQMKRLSLLGNVMLMLMCCVTMSMFNSCAVDDTPVTPPETTPGYPYEDDIDASVKPGDDFYLMTIRTMICNASELSLPTPFIWKT